MRKVPSSGGSLVPPAVENDSVDWDSAEDDSAGKDPAEEDSADRVSEGRDSAYEDSAGSDSALRNDADNGIEIKSTTAKAGSILPASLIAKAIPVFLILSPSGSSAPVILPHCAFNGAGRQISLLDPATPLSSRKQACSMMSGRQEPWSASKLAPRLLARRLHKRREKNCLCDSFPPAFASLIVMITSG